jgi:outer membrane protein assembly factor BamB
MFSRNPSATVVLTILGAALGASAGVNGYFGDRSGVYPDSRPPVFWNDGTNVLWKATTPNLGSGAPVATADRVIVLSEPGWKHDLPVISCYAADTGKLLWEKEIDHLDQTVTNEAARQQVRDAWSRHLAWCRDFYRLFHDSVAAKDSPDVKRRMDEMGVETWGANYLYGKMSPDKLSEYSMSLFGKKHPEAGKAMLGLDTWRCMGSHDQMWIGEVFGTPVTDGESLYVATAWGVYASYDLNGVKRWMRVLPPRPPHDYCSRARSPLLYRDLFISDLGGMVRAFDRTTGELKWEHHRKGSGCDPHEFVSPLVFRVGNRDLLWCAGPAAYTLPEGKPLALDGWKNSGMVVHVNSDRPDTLFFVGGGEHGGWEGKGNCTTPPPAAVRFTLETDPADGAPVKLKANVLWNLVNGESIGGCQGMVYHRNRLYIAGCVVDAETGIVQHGLFGGGAGSGHQLSVAGGHVYGFANGGAKGGQPAGTMTVFDLNGRPVSVNTLISSRFADLDEDSRAKRLTQWYSWPNSANKEWCFTYSASFNIVGDRIYIRSLDHLYCIAAQQPATGGVAAPPTASADVQQRAEALLAAADWDRLAALGPAAKAVAPAIEAALPTAREPWRAVACLAALAPERGIAHADVLVKTIVGSNLSDHLTPRIGATLYELGTVPREQLALIEAAVDRRNYPYGGPKVAQQLVAAFYRRSGEVGFSHVYFRPFPWEGGPKPDKDVTLDWRALNATQVRIEPGIGEVPVVGTRALRLTADTTYTFTAEGPGGPTIRKITVTFPKPKEPSAARSP